jgi:thioredoxin 1
MEMNMSQVRHINAQTFDREVLESSVPVLVDFYATWCAPCRMMGPILERVAAQVGDRAKIVKLDVDEAPEIAAEFQVSSIPSLMLVQDGRVVARTVGLTSAERLVAMIDQVASRVA